MEATYYFDPVCPFTWRTSRWLVSVAPERGVDVRWRPFSLSILNGGETPEEHRPMMAASGKALRLVAALAADRREDTIGAFYTELGTRTHDADTMLSDEIVQAAADAAGIADAKAVLEDASWDDAVRTSHDEAFGSAGPDIGSPVLALEGAPRGMHGPIIGDVPPLDEALAIWDAVVPLARSGTFFELKRGRQ
jgi:2-hydroxychromene-2-carboxylate isomerase